MSFLRGFSAGLQPSIQNIADIVTGGWQRQARRAEREDDRAFSMAVESGDTEAIEEIGRRMGLKDLGPYLQKARDVRQQKLGGMDVTTIEDLPQALDFRKSLEADPLKYTPKEIQEAQTRYWNPAMRTQVKEVAKEERAENTAAERLRIAQRGDVRADEALNLQRESADLSEKRYQATIAKQALDNLQRTYGIIGKDTEAGFKYLKNNPERLASLGIAPEHIDLRIREIKYDKQIESTKQQVSRLLASQFSPSQYQDYKQLEDEVKAADQQYEDLLASYTSGGWFPASKEEREAALLKLQDLKRVYEPMRARMQLSQKTGADLGLIDPLPAGTGDPNMNRADFDAGMNSEVRIPGTGGAVLNPRPVNPAVLEHLRQEQERDTPPSRVRGQLRSTDEGYVASRGKQAGPRRRSLAESEDAVISPTEPSLRPEEPYTLGLPEDMPEDIPTSPEATLGFDPVISSAQIFSPGPTIMGRALGDLGTRLQEKVGAGPRHQEAAEILNAARERRIRPEQFVAALEEIGGDPILALKEAFGDQWRTDERNRRFSEHVMEEYRRRARERSAGRGGTTLNPR